jgi:hypothetical protein
LPGRDALAGSGYVQDTFSGRAPQQGGMTVFPILALTAISFVTPAAEPTAPKVEGCLTPREQREAIGEGRAVQPIVALRAAGAGEKVRALLCKSEAGLVYLITTLGEHGHVSRVVVDAMSGERVGAR